MLDHCHGKRSTRYGLVELITVPCKGIRNARRVALTNDRCTALRKKARTFYGPGFRSLTAEAATETLLYDVDLDLGGTRHTSARAGYFDCVFPERSVPTLRYGHG